MSCCPRQREGRPNGARGLAILLDLDVWSSSRPVEVAGGLPSLLVSCRGLCEKGEMLACEASNGQGLAGE